MALLELPEWRPMPPPMRDGGSGVTPRETLKNSADSARDRQMQVAAENDVIPIVYGRDRIGAKIANVLLHFNHWLVQAVWCLGPIDAIESWQIGDKDPTPDITVTHYLGTASQTPDPLLVEAFAALGVEYSDALTGVVYSVFRIPVSHNSAGDLAAIVRGMKVLDPRSGLTVWSDNPALALANLLSSTDHGAGRAMDWASVATVANICDTLIGGEKANTVGVVLDVAQDVYAWADVLRTYASCWIVQRDNGLALVPDAPADPVMAFRHEDGTIADIGPLRRAAPQDSPTVIIVRWTNTSALPWRDDHVVVAVPGVDAGTVPRRESEVPLPGIHWAGQARRAAVRRLNALTLSDLSFSLEVFDAAAALEPGCVVSVSHPVGLTDKPMRVASVEAREPGQYVLGLIEYDPAAYSADVVTEPTYPDTSLPQPGDPLPVIDLTLSEEVFQQQDGTWSSRIRATWTPSGFPFVGSYRAVVIAGATEVFTGTAGSRAVTWASPAIAEGVSYQVDVSTVSLTGAVSAAASSSIVALGKQLPPGNVPSLSGYEVGGDVRLQWAPAVDIDIWRYEVRYNVVGGAWDTATLIDRIDALRIVSKDVPAGTWDFMVKAIDSVGNQSPAEARRTLTVTLDDGAFLVDTVEYDTPTLTNMQAYRLGRLAGGQRWVTTDGQPWNDVFAAPMNGYTNALLSYQPATAELLTETHDFGLLLTGNWESEITVTDLVGTHTAQMEISNDAVTFDAYPALAAKRGGRLSRVRIAVAGGVIVVAAPDLLTRIDAVPRTENGRAVSSASGPTTIALTKDYTAAKSITVTPMGTAPRSYAIDNVIPGAGSAFDVYIFDAADNQISVDFYWSYEGV